ncbi:MAG: hypothetical protein A2138_19900 [Deltaproteobacteria bacterium RBG_16_71_12]|nr:MAG: hypothetical protein A2138_19900 [Deltaproteobacteria bacterium RBG_16_71_12]
MRALRTALPSTLQAGLFMVLAACGTTPEPAKVVPPPPALPPPDVDGAALCQVVAEVEDAVEQGRARELRDRYQAAGAGDRAKSFGALLAVINEQDRFRAFREDGERFPTSPVAPLGLCFVYADWKMEDQATGVCMTAEASSRGAPIVDVARARLMRKKGSLDAATALVDNALTRDASCVAAHVEAARVHAARGDADRAMTAWQQARTAWPACFLCAVEAARLADASADRASAIPLWEAALAITPGSPVALKHYAAALATSEPHKALAAYQRAVDAGADDLSTLLGGAQLAAASGDVVAGLAFAEKAASLQKNEIDAWRLVLALALRRNDAAQGDPARAAGAAREVLRLVDEDVPALLVLARQARARGNLVDAVVRYDAAARAIAAGRVAGVEAADLEAAKKEHAALLTELHVATVAAKGKPETVVRQVQGAVQQLFLERLKKKKGLAGSLDVAVVVSAAGTVDTVEIVSDSVGDAAVAASVVANLRRAVITGGAKRYSFTMELK